MYGTYHSTVTNVQKALRWFDANIGLDREVEENNITFYEATPSEAKSFHKWLKDNGLYADSE